MEKDELLKEIEEIIKQEKIVGESIQGIMEDIKNVFTTVEDLKNFKEILSENYDYIPITRIPRAIAPKINEEALLEWQEKNKKPKQSLYTAISNYFKEVNHNFTEWKRWMRNKDILWNQDYDYFNRKYIVTPQVFSPKYFESISYVKYRSPYQVYSKLAKNPTITEFVKFVDNWKDGVTRGFPKSGKVFSDFEDMFIDVD